MTDGSIRIVVADDHAIVRQGIAQLLAPALDIEIVGEAATGEAALDACAALSPDIVLMDLRMPGMGGLAATEAIRRDCPAVRIIGLSTFAEKHTASTMLASGAHAHLPKSVTFDELVGTIRRVADGERLEPVVGVPQPVAQPGKTAAMTAHQRRVMALLVKGFTNPEIARYLDISISTANYHVGAILAKLGASNRSEAVAIAVREQLID